MSDFSSESAISSNPSNKHFFLKGSISNLISLLPKIIFWSFRFISISSSLELYSERQENIEINLKIQEIVFGNKRIKFEIDPFKKKCLLEGLDDIALSLEKSEKISSYESKITRDKPWIN